MGGVCNINLMFTLHFIELYNDFYNDIELLPYFALL